MGKDIKMRSQADKKGKNGKKNLLSIEHTRAATFCEAAIKKLRVLEATALQMIRDCRDTIRLIEQAEDVSMLSQNQKSLSDRELAEVSAKRRRRMANMASTRNKG